jgi:predicted TIM-barrel fold metal-dependent hydrolase
LIIDFHTHVFSPEMIAGRENLLKRDRWFGLLYANPKARMATAEDLIQSMDRAGIDLSVTFCFGFADHGLCTQGNDYVIDSISRYPDRLIGFACLQAKAWKRAEAELERCVKGGIRGIGELMPDGQCFDIDDAATMAPLAEAAEHWQLPVMTHTSEPVGHEYPGKGEVHPEAAYRFARSFPRVTLVCGHWGGGLPFYELMPEARQILANVYYDTAASPLLYLDAVFPSVASWASRKILFGTDFPLIGQKSFLTRVQAAGLSSSDLRAVLGGNAHRVLRL